MIASGAQLDSFESTKSRFVSRTRRDSSTTRGSELAASTEAISTSVVTSRRDLHEALGLVYRAYRATGLIDENPFGLRVTKYHLLQTTHVFVAHKLSELAGTLTLVRDGVCGLPMEDLYADEVHQRRARGRKVAEVSCLADASYGKANMLSVVLKLMSHMAQFARRNGVDELLIAVHPHHVGFYQRFIGFEVIGPQADYSAVCDNPAVPLALDLEAMPVSHPKAYERFFGQPFDDGALFAQPMTIPVIAELRQIVNAQALAMDNPYARCTAAVA